MTILDRIVEHIAGEHVYIQTHDFPDPDAISSAFGLQRLLQKKGKKATICYKGTIARSALIKLTKELGIELINADYSAGMAENDEVILVDAQKGNANTMDIVGDKIICIDHHPTFEKAQYRMEDIRPEVGACASIIASYYVENAICMERDVATALLCGIKIDTANLTRGVSRLDLDMFYHLFPHADHDLIKLFEMNSLQFSDLHAYAHAINSIKVYSSVSFANTGENCPEALIAAISDFMLALSEVRFSVVYSIRQNGIKLSVRNAIPDFDAGQITNGALSGIGNGGGHASMAGGFISFSDNTQSVPMLITEIEERFIGKLFPRAVSRSPNFLQIGFSRL